ncbi:MAG: redox-sensing transcriptional repressor Rex [Acutalibacteraceae bacterium]|jgi:redox-sensing transcriptional repressor|nr:redox-sensing transcriptional repressor Rex [Oscillospiraceae bacterium]HCX46201.1 redox-sensing transcriptional repressor Rex [Oscillospiraceae bacterium]
MTQNISKHTLQRLPMYLSYIKGLPEDAPKNISATTIAEALQLNDVQVRKDLASVSSSGKPKVGYNVKDLIAELEAFLGYNDIDNAVIVGAGSLGKALLNYSGFKAYGLNIIAAFDLCEEPTEFQGKTVFPIAQLESFCRKVNIHIGIITVPASSAQEICDLLVNSGIRAIWNFAPVHLVVPDGILVQNENMASSLALLSNHLREQMKK